MSVYLVEITGKASGVSTTYRYCTGLGTYNGGNYYEPRIENTATSAREIFVDGQIGGKQTKSIGEMSLVNIDGGLDSLYSVLFDGGNVLVRYFDGSGDKWVQRYIVDQVTFETRRIRFRLRDQEYKLNTPIQTSTYAGNNSLPSGLEGGPELTGMKKPRCFGVVNNMTPVLVNTSRLIYQVNDGAIYDIKNVYDKGAAFTRGADYASQSAMESTAPAAGEYRVCKAGGYFRIGSSPAGLVTATVWQASPPYYTTAAQLAKDIVTNIAGIASGSQVAADYTTLDALNAGSVGLMCDDGMTIASALDQILSTVGAWWGFDDTGKFRLARFDLPTGAPVVSWEESDFLDYEFELQTINGIGAPTKSVTLNHDINWTAQDASSLAGVVSRTTGRAAWLGKRSRSVKKTASVDNVMAQDLVYETLFAGAGYAGPEATRRLNLLKTKRSRLRVEMHVDAITTMPKLGDEVHVTIPRYGHGGGDYKRVIGIETDFAIDKITFILWG